MGAADVFLQGVEVAQNLGAEVTLKEGVGQAGQKGGVIFRIVHLFKVFIQIEQRRQNLQTILAGMSLLRLVQVHGPQVDLKDSQTGEHLLVAIDATVRDFRLLG